MGKVKDIRGQSFGYLEVPKDAQFEVIGGHAYWPAICHYNDCGTVTMVRGTKLRDGHIKSCGCMRADPQIRSAARKGIDLQHADDAFEAAKENYFASLMEAEVEQAEREARQRQIASPEQAGPAQNDQDDETVAPEQEEEEEYDSFLGAPFKVLPTAASEEPEEAPAEQTSDDTDDFI